MDLNVLIDGIVRQTTVLIAALAAAPGRRAPLAHVANEIFLSLSAELRRQNLPARVIADMFGLALSSYREKVRRLRATASSSGRSLWEAVLAHIKSHPDISRGEVLDAFSGDDELTVRSVLNELVDTRLVYCTGRRDGTRYHARSLEETANRVQDAERSLDLVVWMAICRRAPATRADIEATLGLDEARLDAALARLVDQSLVVARTGDGVDSSEVAYTCEAYLIPYESAEGWEAAVFDHFQAMVNAVTAKVREGRLRARPNDAIGGSTYAFEIGPEHPMEAEVLGLLARVRREVDALHARLVELNRASPVPPDGVRRVIFYAGQTVMD